MRRIWQWLLATLAGLILILASPPIISQARVVTQAVGLDVNSAVIKDVNGNVISHDAVLPQSSEYTVNYTWSIPDGVRVRSGDTMTVQIPTNVEFPEDDSFTMVGMTGGKPIGTFFIAAGSHTGTITLNSQFQYRPLNRRGYLHLAVEGTEPDQPGTLAQIAMSKSGTWADPNDQTKINWSIDVLANGNQLVNPVITDQLSDNQTYVAGSAHLTDELGNAVPVTTTVTGNQIEFQASGAFVTHLNLSYQTTTNEPTGSALFTNFADYTDDGGNSGSADASVDRVTEPENPGTTEPESPGTTEPEKPGTTEPENPGTSEPENPGTTEPENPGTTEPENPDTTEPENPGTTEPENPGTSEPENPGTTEPENPGTTEPENPGTSEPENPGTTEPENPGTTEPENPGTSEPENPGTTEPENPGTTEPENPGTSEPENPGITEPENPGTSEPENPGTTEPENPGTTEPENPGTSEPENPGTTEPENPSTTEPEKPGTTEPEQPTATAPDNSDTNVADTPATENSGTTPTVPNQPDNGTVPTPQRPTVSAPVTAGNSTNGQTGESVTSTPATNGTPVMAPSSTQAVSAGTSPVAASHNPTNTLPQTDEQTDHTPVLLGLVLLIVLLLGGFAVSHRHTTH